MSDAFPAIVFWFSQSRQYGILSALDGTTYLFKADSLARDFIPTAGTFVNFRISFVDDVRSVSGYQILSVSAADLESIPQDDLELLTRAYLVHEEKAQQKLHERRTSEYGNQKCKKLIQERYQIRPLKNRWNED